MASTDLKSNAQHQLQDFLKPYQNWINNEFEKVMPFLRVLGFAWLPALLFDADLNFLDYLGAGVMTLSLITIAQIWGGPGLILWATWHSAGTLFATLYFI